MPEKKMVKIYPKMTTIQTQKTVKKALPKMERKKLKSFSKKALIRKAPRKKGIIDSVRGLIVDPIKRNIKRGYIDIFKHPLGSRDPRVKKKATSRESTKRKTSRQSSRGGGR